MKAISRMDRRQFLRTALVAGGGVCLAGCGLFTRKQSGNYYFDESENILADIDKLLGYMRQTTSQRYGETEAQTLATLTRNKFEELLPGLPYIGGKGNDLTTNLYQAAASLAFYRRMTERGNTLEETGEILYRTMELVAADIPLAKIIGWLMSSSLVQKMLRQEAKQSQQSNYPEDWVFEFVEGDGVNFEYGVDYSECGICKYMKGQDAFELVPYLCLLDFPISEAMGSGLVRTTTLGHGGERCDFRNKPGRPCQREWTPAFLLEEKA